MRVRSYSFAATIALLGAAPLLAQSTEQALENPDQTAQGDVSITIYNGGRSLVQDVRQLSIPAGQTTIAFPDVSARIQPETLSFAAAGTSIVEQNFDFDLLTPSKLMEKAIGKTITLVRTNPATGVETRERATVLSTAGGVVVKIGDRIEVLRDDGLPVRAIFDRVPSNLRARPTLSVTLDSTRSGTRPASIRYLTSGLGWSADYVALFDEGNSTVDMQGWVTLTNQTGTTFKDADLLLVAGDATGGNGRRPQPRSMRTPGTEAAERESLGEFYLYPIEERTTVANAQTKQVSFLDVQGVPARRRYERRVGWLVRDEQPVAASSAISFNTARDQGLGDALPAGTVRFYQRDRQGTPQFIGEAGIGHTPMGSDLFLRTGDAFDVYVQAEVEKREEIDKDEWEKTNRYRVLEDGEVAREVEVERKIKYYRTTMRYTFYNAKSSPVNVEFYQDGLYRGWWSRDYRVVSEDVTGEQQGPSTRKWDVRVPAADKRVVRVVYETKY
ncbi:DUF4139 domain-containing protein [Qipengyuania gelatinilytica]|uniref:DUF4139 domain-containing protein n=1 Tax=Qipengyuania gelatinilytica TaxID=2867231 RepID=A0ABX9A2R2_9SPHN|nr:DUF4139 domain-containing protein [Qipengyuania gelatinilytica]QZD95565.1 DUF4139 domain-containing protein [Qipengyuania gelatinilytica]